MLLLTAAPTPIEVGVFPTRSPAGAAKRGSDSDFGNAGATKARRWRAVAPIAAILLMSVGYVSAAIGSPRTDSAKKVLEAERLQRAAAAYELRDLEYRRAERRFEIAPDLMMPLTVGVQVHGAS